MSNLSYLKIRNKEFFLEVGDTIIYNGVCMNYRPIGSKNKLLCQINSGLWYSSNSIEVTNKYKKNILNNVYDNLVKEEKDGITKWVVNKVYEVIIPEKNLGEMWYLGIGNRTEKSKELFNYSISKIKSRTAKQIVLEKDLLHYSKWNTEEWLNKIIFSKRWGADRLHFNDLIGVFIEIKPGQEEEKLAILEEYKDKLMNLMKCHVESIKKKADDKWNIIKNLSEKEGYNFKSI